MKISTKRKIISGALRGSSPFVAISAPAWLIAQKFPLWATEETVETSLTGAGIVLAVIAALAFRKKFFNLIRTIAKKTKDMRAATIGTAIICGAGLGLCYLITKVTPIMPDIELICTGGVLSGIGGVGLDWAALAVQKKQDDEKTEEV